MLDLFYSLLILLQTSLYFIFRLGFVEKYTQRNKTNKYCKKQKFNMQVINVLNKSIGDASFILYKIDCRIITKLQIYDPIRNHNSIKHNRKNLSF